MNSIAIGAIVFVCTFAGAMIGMHASSRLPDHHLSPASTAVIRLAMAFVVALATLVISLMISSARTSFAAKDAEYRRGAADLILLDRAMIGFVLYDETGQPCVTFGYGTHDEARSAREYVMAALIGVETVRGRR